MSRKRLVSPEFFTHPDLFDAERASGLPLRIAFAGLWTVADRRGYFRWRAREIKLSVLPYDDVDFEAVLKALESHGFIQCYTVDGKEYGRIPSFGEWQSFHPNEKASDVPEPTNGCREPANGRRSNAVLTTALTTGTAPTSTLTAPPKAADVDFDETWPLYPKRTGGNNRAKALKAWRARRRAGIAVQVLRAGLERYAAFVKATGKEGTEYVMQAATFFGPDEHYAEPWTIPAMVVVPPRGRPGPTVTEVADREHTARVALEDRYAAASRRAGLAWASEHPAEFAEIKAQVERSYRGLSGGFADMAIKSELAIRCAKAAEFQPFDQWLNQRATA